MQVTEKECKFVTIEKEEKFQFLYRGTAELEDGNVLVFKVGVWPKIVEWADRVMQENGNCTIRICRVML